MKTSAVVLIILLMMYSTLSAQEIVITQERRSSISSSSSRKPVSRSSSKDRVYNINKTYSMEGVDIELINMKCSEGSKYCYLLYRGINNNDVEVDYAMVTIEFVRGSQLLASERITLLDVRPGAKFSDNTMVEKTSYVDIEVRMDRISFGK